MTLLKCCVIDDEPLAGNLIGSYVERTPALSLAGVFTSAHEAYPFIASGEIDLVFLDIQMPQLSGMEFVKLLPPSAMVVFVTAYENYAIEGIRANAVDYLLKPVNYGEFLGSVNRALARRTNEAPVKEDAETKQEITALSRDEVSFRDEEKSLTKTYEAAPDHIIVKSEYRHRQIPKKDILFIEGLKDYVRIFVEGESRSVMTLLSMKSIEHCLPASDFMRVHRSFIVNLNKINTIERNRILICDKLAVPPADHEIPVGDSYRQAITAYISSRLITSD